MLIPKYNLTGRTKEQLVDCKLQHRVIYFYQETFYSVAFEEMTGVPVEQLVTIVISEHGELQIIKEKRDNWVSKLQELVQDYHNQQMVRSNGRR